MGCVRDEELPRDLGTSTLYEGFCGGGGFTLLVHPPPLPSSPFLSPPLTSSPLIPSPHSPSHPLSHSHTPALLKGVVLTDASGNGSNQKPQKWRFMTTDEVRAAARDK